MMSVHAYDLMGHDIVQCGVKMPKAVEPAAPSPQRSLWQFAKTWIFTRHLCSNVNIAFHSLSLQSDFSELTDKYLFQNKIFYN
jgi:hypothetical protein